MNIKVMSITLNFSSEGDLLQYRVCYQKLDDSGNVLASNALLLVKPEEAVELEQNQRNFNSYFLDKILSKEGILNEPATVNETTGSAKT